MNRSIIVVRDTRSHCYRVIRVHWDGGPTLTSWLRTEYADHNRALELVWQGHRSSIDEAYEPAEHIVFRVLSSAKRWCEYGETLAYHNGKGWRFEGRG
jgi:hypothetical protein